MLLLQTNNVERRFGSDVLFHNMNMQIQEHGRTALVGRNGAGKTTIFNMITGVYQPTSGKFFLDGEDLTGKSQQEIIMIILAGFY